MSLYDRFGRIVTKQFVDDAPIPRFVTKCSTHGVLFDERTTEATINVECPIRGDICVLETIDRKHHFRPHHWLYSVHHPNGTLLYTVSHRPHRPHHPDDMDQFVIDTLNKDVPEWTLEDTKPMK